MVPYRVQIDLAAKSRFVQKKVLYKVKIGIRENHSGQENCSISEICTRIVQNFLAPKWHHYLLQNLYLPGPAAGTTMYVGIFLGGQVQPTLATDRVPTICKIEREPHHTTPSLPPPPPPPPNDVRQRGVRRRRLQPVCPGPHAHA
jgi:hypothetical protein